MALDFNNINGSAIKGGDFYKLTEGENRFRMVGGVVPRYLYWVKNGSDNIPFECLSFDRSLEKFTNIEHDWVQEMVHVADKDTGVMGPIRCSWAYACLVVDADDGKVKILNLKKKMFEQIILNSKKLGNPTDQENGYDIIVNRVKTGPHAFNVEYQLDVLEMADPANKKPLTEAIKTLIEETDPIDLQVPRDTPAQQKTKLDKIFAPGATEDTPDNTDADSIDDI
jgi:hypothetical protein